MAVNPIAVGIGSGIAAGVGMGLTGRKLMNDIGDRHPTGSDADGKARLVQGGLLGVGVVSAFGGMFTLARGNVQLGAALLGGGVGALVGTFAAGMSFDRRHGIGVDTAVDDVIDAYDHDNDQLLDLDPGWRQPEYLRTVSHRHEDDDGDVDYTYTHYSIERLTNAADVDYDQRATRSELRAVIDGYDADRNGRVQGREAARMDREVGERSWNSWMSIP